MLTVLYPELLSAIARDHVGLSVHWVEGRDDHILVIKAPKEYILTAKVNRGFRIYLVPIESDGITTLALMTAFFDDADEPLYLFTPCFGDDAMAALFKIFSSDTFDVHLFDEKNHEWLGYRVRNGKPKAIRSAIAQAQFWSFSYERGEDYYNKAVAWFGLRTAADDDAAIDIAFEKPLFPDNLFVQDLRLGELAIDGSDGTWHSTLERDVEPGPFQERDIVHLLRRTFPAEQIYLNPKNDTDGREVVDIAVITPTNILLIQAKDSPNTEKSLRRTIARKKATVESHLSKAVSQLGGTFSHIRSHDPHRLVVADGKVREVQVAGRTVWGIIILKEIIETEYVRLSPPVLELARESGNACLLMSYFELHGFTHHRRTEDDLLRAFRQTFEFAIAKNQFPLNRFGFIPGSEPPE